MEKFIQKISHKYEFLKLELEERQDQLDGYLVKWNSVIGKYFLDKQKVMYARLSLSDDPQAKIMRDNIAKEAKMIGFPDDVDIGYVFSNICTMIEAMKKTIQENT